MDLFENDDFMCDDKLSGEFPLDIIAKNGNRPPN